MFLPASPSPAIQLNLTQPENSSASQTWRCVWTSCIPNSVTHKVWTMKHLILWHNFGFLYILKHISHTSFVRKKKHDSKKQGYKPEKKLLTKKKKANTFPYSAVKLDYCSLYIHEGESNLFLNSCCSYYDRQWLALFQFVGIEPFLAEL